jgi:hypothetical protein
MLLRLVHGRPVSQIPCAYLAWIADRLAHAGHRAAVLLGDQASWPRNKIVRTWLKASNHRVTRAGGGRRIVGQLPSQRPWRHPIAPRWVPGQRAIRDPTRLLAVEEWNARVCTYDGCENLEPITQPVG